MLSTAFILWIDALLLSLHGAIEQRLLELRYAVRRSHLCVEPKFAKLIADILRTSLDSLGLTSLGHHYTSLNFLKENMLECSWSYGEELLAD